VVNYRPPTLPPFGLADVAGITGAFAVMTALSHRRRPSRRLVLLGHLVEGDHHGTPM
jgi:hypothetical protein